MSENQVTGKARRTWQALRSEPPGQRFQRHYERRQRDADRRGDSIHYVVAGGLILVGIVLVFVPGPAVVFFALAAALLSEVSLAAARALDWTEVRVRRGLAWIGAVWRR